MSKRMYDTGIVQQMWYMELPPRAKALWWQLHAMMDNAGVFEINDRMLEVMFGDKVSRDEIFGYFGNRVQPVPDHPDKGVFVDYVAWSNARGLSAASPSQRSIIARLEELGLSVDKLAAMSRKRTAPRPTPLPPVDDDGEEEEKPKRRKPSAPRFKPPTLEQVKAYCDEMNYHMVDPVRWFNYYSANGWMVGRNHMKDWKAAVRTWTRPKEGGGNVGRKHNSAWRDADLTATDASVL